MEMVPTFGLRSCSVCEPWSIICWRLQTNLVGSTLWTFSRTKLILHYSWYRLRGPNLSIFSFLSRMAAECTTKLAPQAFIQILGNNPRVISHYRGPRLNEYARVRYYYVSVKLETGYSEILSPLPRDVAELTMPDATANDIWVQLAIIVHGSDETLNSLNTGYKYGTATRC